MFIHDSFAKIAISVIKIFFQECLKNILKILLKIKDSFIFIIVSKTG